MNPTAKLLLRVAVAAVFASALAHAATARQDRRGQRAREIRDREARAREDRELQVNLGMLEGASKRRAELSRQIYAQISEDFMRLQVVNSELMQAVSGDGALDLAFVAKSASEIRKRAERLKGNLLLPEPEKDSGRPTVEVGAEAGQLRSALSALGELIYVFVRNPVFKETNVADVKMLDKARRDLEEIIDLSVRIKKSSEKLRKAEKPAP